MEADEMKYGPPELSADGTRNSFNHCCDLVGHYRPYAACLNLTVQEKGGRLEDLYDDCLRSIRKGFCTALAMKAEEAAAGQAIYFTERTRYSGLAASANQFVSRAAREALSKSHLLHKSSVIDSIDTTDYSAVIKTEAALPAMPVIAPVEMKTGESPLEMARRMLSQQG